MPSRKKNKGKERKAKKAEVEAEKIEKERAALRIAWQADARGEFQGRVIIQCNHGVDLVIPEDDHPVTNFIDALFTYAANNGGLMYVGFCLRDTFTTHQEVWENESYREMAVNIFIAIGTNSLLQNVRGGYFLVAHAIVALENYDGEGIVSTLNSHAVSSKVRDLSGSDSLRDALKFFRKRTTCKCLKRMHLEARRTQPKMGGCYHCKERKERALLMVCSRCRVPQYCSKKCQIADWPRHKACSCDKYDIN